MNLTLLDTAKKKIIEGNAETADSFYIRAMSEGIPTSIVDIHRMTNGHLFLAMDMYSPAKFFEGLDELKGISKTSPEIEAEYKKALTDLLNIRTLFLREIALLYFDEIAISSSANFSRSILDMFYYLEKEMDEIVDKDKYGVKEYFPNCDFKRFKQELLKVEAYCLNLLLMYTARKHTYRTGKTYYASTFDFGDYMYTEVNARDNYSSVASVMPRLKLVGLEAYYNDYKTRFEEITKQIGGGFSSPEELKSEITRLVDRKDPKNDAEKDFYAYSKVFEKEDIERRSFFKLTGKLNPFYFMLKPIMKYAFGTDQVGSFDPDVVFTRKKMLGVCHMLSLANNWDIDTVRAIMIVAGCLVVGAFAYVALFISMKVGFYLPNITVDKP